MKDYQDIAAIVRAGVNLSRGLAAACAIYRPNFQPSESLKALAYFDDGDLQILDIEEQRLLVEATGIVRDFPSVVVLPRA